MDAINIKIVAGGVMALDVDKVPPRLDSVTLDDQSPDVWTKAGDINDEIQVIDDSASTSQHRRSQFHLTRAVSPPKDESRTCGWLT